LAHDQARLECALKEVVGEQNVLSDKVDLAVYDCDAETLDLARPDLVVLPGSLSEVEAVVKLANRYQVPFTPRGAGTGLSGGATTIKGGLSLVLTRMTKIKEIDPVEQIARVEVGATNAAVSYAASKYGLSFAPDPSSQNAATIGGNVAENAGGPHTLKYGMTTDHVLGLTIVMPDGQISSFGGRTRCRLGPDWVGLFIGSEGTLGIACEALVKLTPIPQAIRTMLAYFPTLEAGGLAVSEIVSSGIMPAAMEMIDQLTLNAVEDAYTLGLDRLSGALLILELDGCDLEVTLEQKTTEAVIRSFGATSVTWAKDAYERANIWKARKSAFASLGRIAPHGYVLDGVIPRSKLAEAISRIKEIGKRQGLLIANVYHAGDGNLHPCLLYHRDNHDQVKKVFAAGREILQLCVDLGGTLSGEHGIGIEKLKEMPLVFSAAELQVMGFVKEAFDQLGLCNPGKVVPMPKNCGESGMRPLLRHSLSTGF